MRNGSGRSISRYNFGLAKYTFGINLVIVAAGGLPEALQERCGLISGTFRIQTQDSGKDVIPGCPYDGVT